MTTPNKAPADIAAFVAAVDERLALGECDEVFAEIERTIAKLRAALELPGMRCIFCRMTRAVRRFWEYLDHPGRKE